MATTTRKSSTRAAPKHAANGQFASGGKTNARRRAPAKSRAKSLIPDVDFSTRNIALGTAAVAGAAIAGALFAAWRSNAFADLFERDLITGSKAPKEARDVIDDDDREQFAPATVPLRDSKYDRELAAN
ncbi:hypothetical protein SPAN111604_02845 [Sphingomonas antarctica]|uniref:hypothetical protein n=1 Tax=Sphingomonas antarctica TaxID=2040274 RepID=UPI0039EB13DA